MHPRAKQLRQIARGNQNKHFWWAVLITLLATLLAGDLASGVNLRFNLGDSSFDLYNGAYAVDDAMVGLRDFLSNPLVSALASLSTLLGLAAMVIGGAVHWGFARYLLQTHDADCKRPCATLFSGFSYFGKLLGLYWLLALKVFLWALIPIGVVVLGMVLIGLLAIAGMGWFSLAFLPLVVVAMLAASIPAICAEYRYSMAYFLMVENPDLGVSECIQCSINLMRGHKNRLFCLDLSFIGWYLLSGLTCGILAVLYVLPYHAFAHTAFYRDLVPAQPVSKLWGDAAPAPQPGPQFSAAWQQSAPQQQAPQQQAPQQDVDLAPLAPTPQAPAEPAPAPQPEPSAQAPQAPAQEPQAPDQPQQPDQPSDQAPQI